MKQKLICDMHTVTDISSFTFSETEHSCILKPRSPVDSEEGRSRAFDLVPTEDWTILETLVSCDCSFTGESQ